MPRTEPQPTVTLHTGDPGYRQAWVRAVRVGAPVQVVADDGRVLRELRPLPGRFRAIRRLLLAGLGRWLYPR